MTALPCRADSAELRDRMRSRTAGRFRRRGTRSPAVLELERERIFASCLAVRRPARAGRETGELLRVRSRPHSRGHRPRAATASCGVRQRLPPPWPRRRRGQRLPRDTAVPVPRVDLRSGRQRCAGPRSEREPGFDASAFSLLPVSVDTWGPFVFVNPDPDVPAAVRGTRRLAGDDRARAASTSTASASTRTTVGAVRQLEGRPRELPRVLPLPGRASRLQQGDRRRPGRLSAHAGDVDEPARARSGPFDGPRPTREATCASPSTTFSCRTRPSTSRRARRTSRSSAGCRAARGRPSR